MLKFLFVLIASLFSLAGMTQTSHAEGSRAERNAQTVQKGWTLDKKSFRTTGNRNPGEISPKKKISTTAGDGTVLYGEQVYSTLMNGDSEDDIKWGLYSFPAKAQTTFTEKLIHNTICANGGGAYHNGKLYFVSYYEGFEPGTFLYLYFCILDVNTLELEKIALKSDLFTSIALDMTYDPVGEQMYSQTYPSDAATNPNGFFSLSVVDLNTGKTRQIAELDRMSMLACDMSGQLYGVRYSDGMLVKINKGNAHVTEIGMTGVAPQYNGSGTFDYEAGTLYWTTTDQHTGKSGIYEIDTNSGKASLISTFSNDEQVTCLYLPQSTDRYELGDITGLSADFSNTSSTIGSVSLKAPATDVYGNRIEGEVTIYIYADQKLKIEKKIAPGAVLNEQLDLETKGLHRLEAIASHPGTGKCKRVAMDVWVGTDGAAAVSNLKLTKIDDETACLTWDTPTIGEHGMPINPNLVYYEIRRFPGDELISEDATGNEFRDKITDKNFKSYYYTLTSIHKGVKGGTATSNKINFGIAETIPYLETFDSMEAFNSYTAFNHNDDSGMWQYDEKTQCARYKYDTFNQADDWLITPGLDLGTDNTYKLTFKARSEGKFYPEELEVLLGNECDIQAFTTVLIPHTYLEHEEYREYEAVINVKKAGAYFIAFHAITKKGQFYLYLDDVKVENGPNAYIPNEVTNLSISENAENQALTIRFTTPKINFEGTELTELDGVKIFRNEQLIHTEKSPGIGTDVSFTDHEAAAGQNLYRIVGYNAFGEGIAKEISQTTGSDIPLPPTNAKQTTENGKETIISWTAPEKGVNGAIIPETQLSYNIYDNHQNIVCEGVKGNSYTTTVDTSNGQKSVFFLIEAVTSMGKSKPAETNFITYGKAYQDTEFKESFAGAKFNTPGWFVSPIVKSPYNNDFYGRYWGLEHSKYDRGPRPDDQNGDNGCLIAYTDFLDVSSRMITPKINVKNLKNPVLSFWYYHYINLIPGESYSHRNEAITVEAYVDGEFVTMTDSIHLISGMGWRRYDILLKDYVGDKDFQISFKTRNWLSYDQHLDNIVIRDVKDNDLMITALSVPDIIASGSDREITATVHNDGKNTISHFKVEFLRNGEVFDTVENDKDIAFSKNAVLTTSINPDITEAGKEYRYSARVVLDNDELTENDEAEEICSQVVTNNLPKVESLTAEMKQEKVVLNWNEPDSMHEYTKDIERFDAYESFIINDIGDWKTVDIDRLSTYTIKNTTSETGDYDYPNAGEPMAFQVFSPKDAGITSPLWTPYIGNKMLVCFDAAGSKNNDWLISPMVKGGTKVSFMAKSVTDAYGLEKFAFNYSAATDQIYDFKKLGELVSVPDEWTRYEFVLPEDAVYFAINCLSKNSYALLIDEIRFERLEPLNLNLKGYNIYCNQQKINDATVTERMFEHPASDTGSTDKYCVTALYDKGESMTGNEVSPKGSGISHEEAGNVRVYGMNAAIWIANAEGCRVTVLTPDGKMVGNEVIQNNLHVFNSGTGLFLVKVNDNVYKVTIQ